MNICACKSTESCKENSSRFCSSSEQCLELEQFLKSFKHLLEVFVGCFQIFYFLPFIRTIYLLLLDRKRFTDFDKKDIYKHFVKDLQDILCHTLVKIVSFKLLLLSGTQFQRFFSEPIINHK